MAISWTRGDRQPATAPPPCLSRRQGRAARARASMGANSVRPPPLKGRIEISRKTQGYAWVTEGRQRGPHALVSAASEISFALPGLRRWPSKRAESGLSRARPGAGPGRGHCCVCAVYMCRRQHIKTHAGLDSFDGIYFNSFKVKISHVGWHDGDFVVVTYVVIGPCRCPTRVAACRSLGSRLP